MRIVREAMAVVGSGHTFAQKVNYLKYLTFPRGQVLWYDPVTISIVATARCTLACDMCPTHSTRVPKEYAHAQRAVRDIRFDDFREMIDRFANATTVQIIGSGEPLLNKDFFRMVAYAAGKRMTVKTFSNGTTVGAHIDELLGSRLDGITVSLNGHTAEEFARMTGMPAAVYRDSLEAVRQLIAKRNAGSRRLKVKLSFIIDRENYRSIPAMAELGLALGADHLFFCNFLAAPFDGLRAEERVLMAERDVGDELAAMFGRFPAEARRKMTPPVLVARGRGRNGCATHFSQIRFDGEGNVSSCSMMLLNMAGNGSFREPGVWNNAFFRSMRKAFLDGADDRLQEPCRVCPDNRGVAMKRSGSYASAT